MLIFGVEFLCSSLFFSRFFFPSHLCGFAFAIFLIFTSCLRFCLCLSSSSSSASSSSFCCLLALCCLLRKLPMQKRREYFMHQHKACLAENCRLCSLLPFSFCFRWTPPNSTRTFFSSLFCCPFESKSKEILGGDQEKAKKIRRGIQGNPRGWPRKMRGKPRGKSKEILGGGPEKSKKIRRGIQGNPRGWPRANLMFPVHFVDIPWTNLRHVLLGKIRFSKGIPWQFLETFSGAFPGDFLEQSHISSAFCGHSWEKSRGRNQIFQGHPRAFSRMVHRKEEGLLCQPPGPKEVLLFSHSDAFWLPNLGSPTWLAVATFWGFAFGIHV